MNGRAVGMAVDQSAHAKMLHHPGHFFRRDVDNVVGFHAGLRTAFIAQLARQLVSRGLGQIAQDEERQWLRKYRRIR